MRDIGLLKLKAKVESVKQCIKYETMTTCRIKKYCTFGFITKDRHMQNANKLLGKAISETLKQDLINKINILKHSNTMPKMTAILCTDDPSAISYANSKKKIADSLSIEMQIINLGANITQENLLRTITSLNADKTTHGIILEFPVNENIDPEIALNQIAPYKDVDGLNAINLGYITMGKEDSAILPATPQACIMLAENFCSISGKKVAVIGRGRTVGKPLINMLINRHATVTVCHSKTANIKKAIEDCEIVFVAIGKAHAIGNNELHDGQVVIDAGINFINDRLAGDVNPNVYEKLKAYTPVPGGVGVLTSTVIFQNLLTAIRLQLN